MSWSQVQSLDAESVLYHCRIYEIDKDSLSELFGSPQGWLRADRVDRARAEALFSELGARLYQNPFLSPKLTLRRGDRGYITVSNEVAFIESFELRPTGHTTLGDPKVGVARDGFGVEIESSEGDAQAPCEFNFRLSLAQLQRPIQEATSRLPGLHTPMTVQTPIFATQQVELKTELREQDALLVGPIPAFEGDRSLLVMVTVCPVEPKLEADPGDAVAPPTESKN